MATVTREPIGNLHEKLVVKITKEDYYPAFETALKQFSKNAAIPGFRKGNVPKGMVKKMYGQSVFVDEVIRSANRELESYLKESKPEIFAQPLAMDTDDKLHFDMNQPNDFDFVFEIGLKPDFEITPLNKKGSITRYKIEVTDKLVDDEVSNITRRAGKVENPESFEQDTDIVYASYEACDEAGNVAAITEKTEDVVTLEQMPKKLAAELKTMAAGATFVFVPATICTEEELPEFMKSALRKEGNEAAAQEHYKMTLTKIGRLVPRELNEEFFAEAFPGAAITDEAGFRDKVKAELNKETDKLANDRLQNEIFETLIHETQLELPVDFLKAWLKRSGEKEKTDEEVVAEFPNFDHQLRWTLISDKLIREYDIQVTLEEVMQDVKTKVMSYFGMQAGDEAEWMDSYLEKMSKDEKTMDETYRRLLFDKLFVKIAEVMEIPSQEVSEEEFSKQSAGHHHHH